MHAGVKSFYHHEKEAGKTTVSIATLRQRCTVPDTSALQRTLIIQDVADQIVQNRLDRLVTLGASPCTVGQQSGPVYTCADLIIRN